MNVTRQHVEAAIARLKGEDFFRLDQAELNRPYGQLDVFPNIRDRDVSIFSPTFYASQAQSFLMWTKRAALAFDSAGTLVRALPIYWAARNFWSPLQMAFARQGLVTRFESPAPTTWEGYPLSGTLVLSPDSGKQRCDLVDLIVAFDELKARGVIALANAGQTQSAGWEDVREASRGRDATTAVFWHDQSHDAFDGRGQLRPDGLRLYWQGDVELIASGIRDKGFIVEVPPLSPHAMQVLPSPTSVAPTIEMFAAAVDALPRTVAHPIGTYRDRVVDFVSLQSASGVADLGCQDMAVFVLDARAQSSKERAELRAGLEAQKPLAVVFAGEHAVEPIASALESFFVATLAEGEGWDDWEGYLLVEVGGQQDVLESAARQLLGS